MLAVDPTNNQSFKATNVVRVSKSAFKNPENIKACQWQVDKTLNGSGSKLKSIWFAIKNLFGIKSNERIFTDPIGVFMDAPKKEGFHTFSVIAGNDADEMAKKFTLKNMAAFIKENNIENNAEAKECLIRKLKWENNTKQANEITVNTLEELKSYIEKIYA